MCWLWFTSWDKNFGTETKKYGRNKQTFGVKSFINCANILPEYSESEQGAWQSELVVEFLKNKRWKHHWLSSARAASKMAAAAWLGPVGQPKLWWGRQPARRAACRKISTAHVCQPSNWREKLGGVLKRFYFSIFCLKSGSIYKLPMIGTPNTREMTICDLCQRCQAVAHS